MNIKSFVKHYFYPLVLVKRKLSVFFQKIYFNKKSNAEIFSLVYEKQYWGGGDNKYYSGRGSYDNHIVSDYIDSLIKFLDGKSYTIIDAGCGDMNVSSKIIPYCKKYIGVDVVQGLIDNHIANFKDPNVEFYCLDLVCSMDCTIGFILHS
jgi:SAM-dependent methyltransferase